MTSCRSSNKKTLDAEITMSISKKATSKPPTKLVTYNLYHIMFTVPLLFVYLCFVGNILLSMVTLNPKCSSPTPHGAPPLQAPQGPQPQPAPQPQAPGNLDSWGPQSGISYGDWMMTRLPKFINNGSIRFTKYRKCVIYLGKLK
jgi:hypothetical protein